PNRIAPEVVCGGWARRCHSTMHWGQEPQIGDEGPEVFFIPVRGMIPDHALPVQHTPIATDATADGAGHCGVAPGPNTRLLVRGDIAHPQRSKGMPADLQTATDIIPMAEGA